MNYILPLASLSQRYPSFLLQPSNEPNVLTTEPVPETLRDLSRFTDQHRATLVQAITADLEGWDAPKSALESAETLRQSNAYAVVTGQQAGVATGPLYTLYKAVGAVAMARNLAERFPEKAFVPVFWIEADDHDFDEARTITLLERNGDPRTIRYDDGNERRIHVGDRTVNREGWERFIAEAQEILGETDFSADLFAHINEAYGAEGRTLADGFARSLYTFIGDTPLVAVSSRNATLKGLAADIFAGEAENPEGLYQALRSRTDALAAQSLPTPIDPKIGALSLTHEGERRFLDSTGEEYTVRGTDVQMSRAETAAEARTNPHRFSPNVALRPIVQDAIFPSAIYLAGPSEFAYLRQLQDAYSTFGMEQPCIAPRPFVALVEPKAGRVIESSGIPPATLFDPTFDPATYLVDGQKAQELAAAVQAAQTKLHEAFAGLEEITGQIDKSLENTLGASERKAEKELENFGNRLNAALKRKNETEINRLEGALALLLPAGKLQERSLNALYYANKYGIEAVRKALTEVAIVPAALQGIEIG